MKKTLLFTISIALFGLTSKGQIIDAGFENWTTGSPCSDTDDWGTANGTTGQLGVCTVTQETSDPHSGSSAIKLTSTFIAFANATAPGVASTGTVDALNQTITGGQAFTERPTSFSGWYKGAPQTGDSYSFLALLINENSGDTVGTAEFSSNATVSTWTSFNAPVNYTSQDDPTILQIILSSSVVTAPVAGSEATFDDLDYEVLAVGTDEYDVAQIKTYPNPVVDQVTFDLGNIGQANLEVYDILGLRVFSGNITEANRVVDVENLARGTYVYQLSTVQGEALKTGKLLLVK